MKNLGANTEESRTALAQIDRLDKLYGQILNSRLTQMADASGNITDARQRLAESISPSVDKRPEANALLMADFLQEELRNAIESNATLTGEQIAKANQVIDGLRSQGTISGKPMANVIGAAEEIATYSLDKLQELKARASELTDEQLQALAKRWDKLNE